MAKIPIFFLLILVAAACTTASAPVFDTSSIAADARASAEAAIALTQVATTELSDYPAELESADASNGESLFNTFQADAGFACATCHFPDSENPLIGPGLLNVSSRAASRVEGQSAYDYIFTSISNPDAYVVENFSADLMPENWAEIFSADEINDIIAYLWTLEG